MSKNFGFNQPKNIKKNHVKYIIESIDKVGILLKRKVKK